MFLWLKRIFYGCDHDWKFIHYYKTWDETGKYIVWQTSIHRCQKCMKIKRDVFKN